MKTTILKSVLFLTLTAGIFTSCVNDDDYEVPSSECIDSDITANKLVSEISGTATVKQYLADDIIEAYVSSSDEGGNFFKTISFQTKDGTKGFSIPVDATSTYINFRPGQKVYVKLKDLFIDSPTTGAIGLRLGSIFFNSSGAAAVGRMPESLFRSTVKRSCEIIEEKDFVRTLTIEALKNDANLNTLVELENVQFVDAAIASTYYSSSNDIGGATNWAIVDTAGKTIDFRTSSFATYAGKPVPDGSGKIRGVLTKFNSGYQFMARTERDVQLTGERFTVDLSAPALGGSAITYSGSFTENFESYGLTAPTNREFPKYINDPIAGTRYWEIKQFPATTGNKYIQMTSFGGTPEVNRTVFLVPVDMTAASTFSFQSKAGFANGNALKVYYILATDYTPGGPIDNSKLVDITSNFTLSQGQASGYPADFTNSGNYAIPATLTGNGFFVFEYAGNGNGGVTTTVQLDNIVVN